MIFMAGHQPPVSGPGRTRQVTTALRLVWVSVAFGILSGAGISHDRAG
jgi:hypothetical protein